MYCIKCGSQNADTSSFCYQCGAPLWKSRGVTPRPQVEWTPAAPPAEPVAEPAAEEGFDLTPEQAAPAQQPSAPAAPPQAPPPYAPPSYPYPFEEPLPAEPKRRPAPSGGTRALTVLLCLFFFLFVLLASTVGITRNLLDDDCLEHAVESADINAMRLRIDGKHYSPAECLYENLSYELRPHLTVASLERALDAPKTRAFLAEVFEDYADFLTGDGRLNPLDTDRIVRFLQANPDVLGLPALDDLAANETAKTLERSFQFDRISESRLTREGSLRLLRFTLSPIGYGILIFLSVLVLALILFVNRANIPACLCKVFTTLLLLGIVFLLAAVAALSAGLFVNQISWLSGLFLFAAAFLGLRGGVFFLAGLIGIPVSRHTAGK